MHNKSSSTRAANTTTNSDSYDDDEKALIACWSNKKENDINHGKKSDDKQTRDQNERNRLTEEFNKAWKNHCIHCKKIDWRKSFPKKANNELKPLFNVKKRVKM